MRKPSRDWFDTEMAVIKTKISYNATTFTDYAIWNFNTDLSDREYQFLVLEWQEAYLSRTK